MVIGLESLESPEASVNHLISLQSIQVKSEKKELLCPWTARDTNTHATYDKQTLTLLQEVRKVGNDWVTPAEVSGVLAPDGSCSFLEGHECHLSSKSARSAWFENTNPLMKLQLVCENFLQAEVSAAGTAFPSPPLSCERRPSRALSEVTVLVARRSLWGSTNSRAKRLMLEQVSYGDTCGCCFSTFILRCIAAWLCTRKTCSTKLLPPQANLQ